MPEHKINEIQVRGVLDLRTDQSVPSPRLLVGEEKGHVYIVPCGNGECTITTNIKMTGTQAMQLAFELIAAAATADGN